MIKKLYSPPYRRQPILGALNEINGHVAFIVKAHTENDAIGGAFANWSTVTYSQFLDSVQPQIEWLYSNNIPYDISCTYDFATWAADKTVSGVSLLQWFLNNGCTLSTRAHDGGAKNAVDAAWALNEQGITHNGLLGTADDITAWMDEAGDPILVGGTLHPEFERSYNIALGTAPLDDAGSGTHYGVDSFPVHVYRPITNGGMVILNGGYASNIQSKASMTTLVANGTLPMGVFDIMSNMGRLSNYATRVSSPGTWPNAGPGNFMSTPINTHGGAASGSHVTGGNPLKDEIESLIDDLSQITTNYKFYSPIDFINLWTLAEEPTINYDELDYTDI